MDTVSRGETIEKELDTVIIRRHDERLKAREGTGPWRRHGLPLSDATTPAGGSTRCTTAVAPGQTHCYQHDPHKADERRRNASRGGRSKGSGGELSDIKRQLKGLASDVLESRVERGSAAVVNQILNTLIRAIEQERKMRELEELEGRLEALEEVLKGRKAG